MATGRVDPERRDRIIDATIDLIADAGVVGVSHRKVAERAGVPLGSMTYHFASMDELLHEAFARFSVEVSERFEARMGAAAGLEAAREAVVDLIELDVFADQRELVLTQELSTLAAHRHDYRPLVQEWMRRSRHALERHFDPAVSRQLDAFIEGMTLHRALDDEPVDRAFIRDAVERLTTAPKATAR